MSSNSRNKRSRSLWKHVLASTVITLSVAPACTAQQRGRLLQAILDRYDTDGDGKLSEAERAKLPNRGRRIGRPGQANESRVDNNVPEKLKTLYKSQPGPHTVESIASLKLDASYRDDDLPIRVTYPKSTGMFPVIVFSHGAYGSKDGYNPIVKHWASHGYVVVQGTHGDSLSLVSMEERIRVATSANPFVAMPVEKHWRTRAQDVANILDSLADLSTKHSPLRGKMDLEKIAVGGHSYGSNTTQLIGGLNFGVDLKHDEVKALLLLSPPGPNARLGATAYSEILAPVLTVTGSKDNVAGRNQNYTDRLKTHENIPSREKYLLFMQDAEHNLGGVSGSSGRMSGGRSNPTHLTSVKSATIAFWDAQLKSDAKAKAFLISNEMSKRTEEISKLSR